MHVKMPDITQAQVAAAITWVVTQLISWGIMDGAVGQRVLSASASLLAFAWILGDSIIRHGRNQARAAIITATGVDPAQVRD